jgi:hypothetical protein
MMTDDTRAGADASARQGTSYDVVNTTEGEGPMGCGAPSPDGTLQCDLAPDHDGPHRALRTEW